MAGDDDRRRESERHHERRPEPEHAAAARCAEHQTDPQQRHDHRQAGAARDRLAQHEPRKQRGPHGRHGLHEEDARDRRMVQRDDECG